jgi:MFS family permease
VRSRIGGLPRPFWFLWAGTLINRIGTMVEPFMAFYLTGVRGLSVLATGAVMAIFGVGSILSQVIGGVAADRIGRRATITAGMLGNAVSMIALGYVRPVPAIIGVAFALGLTIDMYRPASQAVVADLIPAADRPRAYGLLFWAVNLGFAVAMVTGGALARAGFVWLFWTDAATCAAFGVLAWRTLPPASPHRPPGDGGRDGFVAVLRDRVMIVFVLITLGYMFVYLQAFTTMPLAMHLRGLPPAAYGFAIAVNGIAIVIVQPLIAGWLADRDHSIVLATGMTIVGAGFGLTSLASAAPSYAAAVLVWTLGEIACTAVAAAIVADLAPAHLRGRYAGLYGCAWSVGVVLAPLAGTRLLSVGAPVLWLTCAGLCVVAAVGQLALAPAVRRRRGQAATHRAGPRQDTPRATPRPTRPPSLSRQARLADP